MLNGIQFSLIVGFSDNVDFDVPMKLVERKKYAHFPNIWPLAKVFAFKQIDQPIALSNTLCSIFNGKFF